VPLAPSTRLGAYEIIGPLGSGGMGEVYRARDTRLGREVALKLLPDALASSPDRLARFEREARTVASINHPNIVVLHSIEEDRGTRFLTMELVDGRSLADSVAAGGMSAPQLLDIAVPLADALVAAHEKGVVHRDLKPANVMLTRDSRVKVLDFGLAKLLQDDTNLAVSQAATMATPISESGVVVGTAPYMAPEQIRGETVDARSDIFSFGVLIYELATGKRPFTGQTSIDVSSSILRDTPTELTTVRSDLPRDLAHIVERCLEKNPRERFQTALDVANELRSVRRTLERGAPTAPKPGTHKEASIAVLPFVNRSASADDEYFSDGLADELLNVLAKIRGLRVSARTSAFHFKGKDATVAEIGRALNVETVLEGSVRKSGMRVRVSVQLVKVSDSYQLWSETYDRTLEDILAVQDDIARSVVKELRQTLLGEEEDSKTSGEARAEVAKAAIGRATDPEAHRLFLLARHLLSQNSHEDLSHAAGCLNKALARDPQFAQAWVGLASIFSTEANRGWAPVKEGYERSREALEKALALEPELAEAHAQMAWNQFHYDWDWKGGERSLARALQLEPGNRRALNAASVLAKVRGKVEEGIAYCRRALELNPLASGLYQNLGRALQAAGSFEEADEAYQKALEISPRQVNAHSYRALNLVARGRAGEALEEAMLEPEEVTRLYALAAVHWFLGRKSEADDDLEQLIEKYANIAAYQIAETHALREHPDAAFRWLERAYAGRDAGLLELPLSPRLRGLHADPRWSAFIKKMGFDSLDSKA
jgi:serine/threonine protein kinase/tetratricopeptide (TPR) repeat protein